MAVIFGPFSFSASPLPLCSCFRSPLPSNSARLSYSSSSASPLMDPLNEGEPKRFMEFPYVSSRYRDLMVKLVSTLESRLNPYLLPCNLPPDVQSYHNHTRTAHASLHIRSGLKPSPIDFMLGSWLHCELPSGSLNIMSLSAYLSPSTDAPNFLMEIIQSSPTSLVFILDLPPRKDLVLHPDYLQAFYEDTQLDRCRQQLERLPEVQPYSSSSLYIRCVVSPTAILVRIEAEAGRTERMEEIVRDHVSPVANEVLGIWLDRCAFGGREVREEIERADLARRDQVIKNKTVEIDLGSSLPRLFGEEVAGRVLGAIREVFNA
ncbi:red chlorophyll catabolite reductase [Sarracenia purpurea var. burkii]